MSQAERLEQEDKKRKVKVQESRGTRTVEAREESKKDDKKGGEARVGEG